MHVLIGAGVGAVVGFVGSVVSDVIAGKEIYWGDAFVSAGVGLVTGGLSAAGAPVSVLVGVNAGLSAAESVYGDIKDNITENAGNSVI